MEAESLNNHPTGVLGRLLPAVGPVLLVAIGYIDPGKWAATVEGGARFGFDLAAPLLIFNFAAIFCQYLSARISVVAGRDLAQICSAEYNKFICMFLGVQTIFSVIALDLSMILGIAHGLNLLFGVDLSICVFIAAVDAVLFPVFATLLERGKGIVLCTWIASCMLLLYFLGVLLNQPEIPLSTNGIVIKFSGESAFALMSLLGANIMPHNFFLHSSIVAQHQGSSNVSKSALCLDHFFTILCVFSGIYVVNFVLMNSAANVFYNTGIGVLTFPDAISSMEQVFRNPLAPLAFFLILYLANQTTALTWNLGGQVVVHDFLRLDIPNWLQRATIRTIAIVPALYCVWTSGLEGIYQLLIFTQVMVALLLPSSVIPLFRVASSRQIMGVYKISQFLEFLVVITFIGMLGLKIVFVVEMVFGDSDWVANLRWSMGSSSSIAYIAILLTAFSSFCLMLWLAATPLKSATQLDAQEWNWDAPKGISEPSMQREAKGISEPSMQREADSPRETRHVSQESVPMHEQLAEPANSAEDYEDITVANAGLELPETIMQSDAELRLTTIEENHPVVTFPSSSVCLEPELSADKGPASLPDVADVVSDGGLPVDKVGKVELIEPIEKTVGTEEDLVLDKDDDEVDSWEPEEVSKGVSGSTSTLTSDGPGSFRSLSGKSDDGGSSAGSLSRVAGLGRAARRQLASVLDEFWGQLYDFHGQVTQDVKSKKLDSLSSDSKFTPSALRVDATRTEFNGLFSSAGGIGSDTSMSTSLCDSPSQLRAQEAFDASYGAQRGSSSPWSNHMQLLDAYVHGSSHNVDSSERRYSSVRTLPSSDVPGLNHSNYDSGERRYSSVRTLPSSDVQGLNHSNYDSGERRYSSVRTLPSSGPQISSVNLMDTSERRYSSVSTLPSSDQPATVHGYQIASIVNRLAKERSSISFTGQMESRAPMSPSLRPRSYMDPLTVAFGQKSQNGFNSSQAPGFHNVAVSRNGSLQPERPYHELYSTGSADSSGIPTNAKKYHSLPDISGISGPYRDLYAPQKNTQWDNSVGSRSLVGRTGYDSSFYSTTASGARGPLTFESQSTGYGDAFSYNTPSLPGSIWSKQPYEKFGVADRSRTVGIGVGNRSNMVTPEAASVLDTEAQLLQSFRRCIVKLIKLEGSDWLFRHHDGADEDLIDRVAARERYLYEAETREINRVAHMSEAQYLYSDRKSGLAAKNDEASITNLLVSSVPNCGDGCVYRLDLIVSFGVWCIHRVLDLSLMESRPELWGKYTYVLNRLQGIIDLAFSKPRSPLPPCFCLQIPAPQQQQQSSPPLSNGMLLPPAAKPGRGKVTTAAMVLDMIKDVETAISCRKGRSGTAAGDVAFPKGKENLASVLKRYKRRLSNANKPVGGR